MKKLLIILCFLPMFSFGGTIYKVLSDTVFIGSIPYRSATGELLLFNATKDTTESVLYNTGNGRTEFKKVRLIRLNDSTYVFKIGTTVIGDSIKIHSGGSGGGGGGSGTVTDFIFTDGNGFDGTVTNSTTTPTLSLVGDTIYKFASVTRVLDSLIDVNARIKNGDSIYFIRTFAQLKSAMSAHTLKKGASYQMAFESIYDQPDFHPNGVPKDTVVTKTASTEHLVFVATSDSTFAPPNSIEYPTDVLNFDWNFVVTEVMNTPTKGRISYRQDVKGNICDYDFRTIQYLRYRKNGLYSEWKDNDSISAEFPTFDVYDYSFGNTFTGYTTGYSLLSQSFILPNVVFQGTAIKNKFDVVFNSTFVGDANENTIGDGSKNIISLGTMYYSYFGHQAINVLFLQDSDDNYFGDRIENCQFGNTCTANSIWDKLLNFTAGDNFERNIQYGLWSNSTVGDNFTDGVIYGNTDSITAGDDNFKIEIKSGLAVTIGDNNSNISFGGTKHILASPNDFNGVKNVSFGGSIDGYFWTTGFTVGAHPQMYQTTTKTIVKTPNGNVYLRYLNDALTDVVTIIN